MTAPSGDSGVSWRQAVERALQVLGGNWVVAILTALADGPRSAADLLAAINSLDDEVGRRTHKAALTWKVQQETVGRMMAAGLIVRTQMPATPLHPSVWYRLTNSGRSLLTAVAGLAEWSEASDEVGASSRQAVEHALHLLDGEWEVAILTALAAGPQSAAELVVTVNALDDQVGRHTHEFRLGRQSVTRTLKRMANADLVMRTRSPKQGPAALYRLTPRGRSLLAAVRPLAEWAQRQTSWWRCC
jgi:DNA-binding HxlR family transcriptional regulator